MVIIPRAGVKLARSIAARDRSRDAVRRRIAAKLRALAEAQAGERVP